MYAVIQSGGKQYKVAPGEILKVEKLDSPIGETINFDRVLMVANGDEVEIGQPCLDNVMVTAKVTQHGRNPKISIMKFKRRKHYQKKIGHRQSYTTVSILSISAKKTS